MDLIVALIIGIVQGITEWLPISSQGQITAIMILLGYAEQGMRYAIYLHTGTLFAAIIYFRKEIIELLKNKENQKRNYLIIATLATAITAIPSYLILKELNLVGSVMLVLIGIMLLFTGLIQRKNKAGKKTKEIKDEKEDTKFYNTKNAILLGLAQGFSVIPGISRSGITTATLLFQKKSPTQAFKISFLLSIPSVFLSQIAINIFEPITVGTFEILALLMSFIFGLITIKILIKFAAKINFEYFCYFFAILYFLSIVFI